jgi:hypothetical protein
MYFEAEYQTVCWIWSQNEELGLAPSPAEVFSCLQRRLGHLERQCQISTCKARKFAARLRNIWRLGFRKYEAHDDTTPADGVTMARDFSLFSDMCASIRARFLRNYGSLFGSIFWTHYLTPILFTSYFPSFATLGSLFGSIFWTRKVTPVFSLLRLMLFGTGQPTWRI